MHLAIFSSTDAAGFAPQWTRETVAVLFGSARLDLTERPPADGAVLNVGACFGSITIVVPVGSRLSVRGLTLFGGRSVQVRAGEGPALCICGCSLFGSIDIIEGPLPAYRKQVIDTRIFAQLADEVGIIPVEVGIQPSS